MNHLLNNTSTNSSRQHGGLVMNMGIGIVLGLLVALLAVFLVTKGDSPFREQKTNVLESSGQVTDPNAPLYGANSATPVVVAPIDGASVAPIDVTTSATVATAQPVSTPAADPVSSIIKASTSAAKPVPTVAPKVEPKEVATNTPKVVKPAVAPKTTAAPYEANSGGKYTVQAGAFDNADDAAALKSKLAAKGQSVSITEKKTANGSLYRVRVGSYASDKEAQAARSKVGGVVLELNK